MQKFKELTTKEKAEHIWYYYKWHIIISVFAIAFIINMVQDIMHRDDNLPLFTISLQGYTADYDKVSSWEKDITNQIEKKNEDVDKKTRVDFYPINSEKQDEFTTANLQKFMVMATAGELDIVCLDEEMFMRQAKMGYYKEIDSIPELTSVIDKNKGIAVKTKTEEGTEEHIYGFRVDDMEVFQNIGYIPDGKIMGIAGNTKRLSYSIDFLKLFFEK